MWPVPALASCSLCVCDLGLGEKITEPSLILRAYREHKQHGVSRDPCTANAPATSSDERRTTGMRWLVLQAQAQARHQLT